MVPKSPVFDVLITRDGDAWRLYYAPNSWIPGGHADERRSVPVGRPDLANLESFMWSCDAPYEVHPTADGGAKIVAAGRSAICFLIWHYDLTAAGR